MSITRPHLGKEGLARGQAAVGIAGHSRSSGLLVALHGLHALLHIRCRARGVGGRVAAGGTAGSGAPRRNLVLLVCILHCARGRLSAGACEWHTTLNIVRVMP